MIVEVTVGYRSNIKLHNRIHALCLILDYIPYIDIITERKKQKMNGDYAVAFKGYP